MGLVVWHHRSEVLQLSTAALIVLPDGAGPPAAEGYPCLWLLHGLSDNHTTWQRRTSVERYADSHGLAVVMPEAGRSFYADMRHGLRYWTYLTEELPAMLSQRFRLSTARQDSFVAGLSMGGYGAFRCAFMLPDRFAAAASFSGALDMVARRESLERTPVTDLVYGEGVGIRGTTYDLFHLAEEAGLDGGGLPPLYQWCGTEDFLYENNLRFRDHATSRGIDLTYEEGPGGHEWGCWDTALVRYLGWLRERGLLAAR
jgi:S-formylglutathione hydrolase FrmB